MTQEEKRLLLVDLCGRSPYGVKVNINSPIEEQNRMELFDVNLEGETIGVRNEKWMFRAVPVENEEGWIVRPYLRRMESMTEEERKEYFATWGYETIHGMGIPCSETYDWLDAHYLDYRGLIEKGLADEALEGMYKFE